MADDIPFRKEMIFEYGVPRDMVPGVRRIVANNPSPFTYKGTNTYILGRGDALTLIDPGPEDERHFDAMMKAIGPKRLTHVVITHTHRDHIDGLPRLVAATGAKVVGYGRRARNPGVKGKSPSGGESFDEDFTPDIAMKDGDRLEGEDHALTALFTPGHAPDHLCFQLDGTRILFSGDHVMSWNTSVVAPPEGSMTAYMSSLDKLLGRDDEVYFPGHGGRLGQPQRVVRAFILHRRMREDAIFTCIKDGKETIPQIVEAVYRGLDPRLVNAASLSVAAHVESLVDRGLVTSVGPTQRPDRVSAV